MSLLSERAFTVHAHASPTDAKRSHPSAPLAWVGRFTAEVRCLSRAFLSNSYRTFLRYLIGGGFALQERDFALGTSESNRFYALSPSEVCYLASSSSSATNRALVLRLLLEQPRLVGVLCCCARATLQ